MKNQQHLVPPHQCPLGEELSPRGHWKNDPNQPFHQPATQMLLNLYYSGCNQSSGAMAMVNFLNQSSISTAAILRCWLRQHLNERDQSASCKVTISIVFGQMMTQRTTCSDMQRKCLLLLTCKSKLLHLRWKKKQDLILSRTSTAFQHQPEWEAFPGSHYLNPGH